MKCSEFELILPDFLEGELGGCGNSEALGHIKECKKCNDMLQEIITIRRQFSSSFDYSNVEFSSRKKQIINSIDKNKYKRKTFSLRRNAVIASTIAATIAGAIIFNPYIKNHFGNKIQIESTNDIGRGKDEKSLMRSSENIKKNIYTEMRREVDEKLNTVGDVIIKNKDDIYRKILEKNQPISGITNKDDFYVFRTDNYVFGYDKKTEKYYGFCDMNKVANSNSFKMVFGTEDGRFIIFTEFGGKEDDIYIVDLITDKINYVSDKGGPYDFYVMEGDSSDSVILVNDKTAIEFEDLKKSMRYKEYTEENLKELLSKDITLVEWNGFLSKLSKQVYGDKLSKDDKIRYYKNKKLYVERNKKLIEITKNNSEVIEGVSPDDGYFFGNNIIAYNNKTMDVINMDTRMRFKYDIARDIRVSHKGDFIIDLKEDKEWIEAKFPKDENRNPLKLIEKKFLNQKSLVDVDDKGRVIIVSGLDKEKVFNIKTVKVK